MALNAVFDRLDTKNNGPILTAAGVAVVAIASSLWRGYAGSRRKLEDMSLLDAVNAASAHAVDSMALHPQSLQRLPITGGEDSPMKFLVTHVVRGPGASSKPDGVSPVDAFASPDPDLHVRDFDTDGVITHRLVLNKYPVGRHHCVLYTRDFVPMSTPLDRDDFLVWWNCVTTLHALGFANIGPQSGGTQPRKHVQFLPLSSVSVYPHVLRGEGELDMPPVDGVIKAARSDQDYATPPFFPFQVAELPFKHEACVLGHDVHTTRAHSAPEDLLRAYQKMLTNLGCANGDSHNVLLTPNWMMVIPRTSSTWDGTAINALAFAGLLTVKKEQGEALEDATPLGVLRHLAQGSTATGSEGWRNTPPPKQPVPPLHGSVDWGSASGTSGFVMVEGELESKAEPDYNQQAMESALAAVEQEARVRREAARRKEQEAAAKAEADAQARADAEARAREARAREAKAAADKAAADKVAADKAAAARVKASKDTVDGLGGLADMAAPATGAGSGGHRKRPSLMQRRAFIMSTPTPEETSVTLNSGRVIPGSLLAGTDMIAVSYPTVMRLLIKNAGALTILFGHYAVDESMSLVEYNRLGKEFLIVPDVCTAVQLRDVFELVNHSEAADDDENQLDSEEFAECLTRIAIYFYPGNYNLSLTDDIVAAVESLLMHMGESAKASELGVVFHRSKRRR